MFDGGRTLGQCRSKALDLKVGPDKDSQKFRKLSFCRKPHIKKIGCFYVRAVEVLAKLIEAILNIARKQEFVYAIETIPAHQVPLIGRYTACGNGKTANVLGIGYRFKWFDKDEVFGIAQPKSELFEFIMQ